MSGQATNGGGPRKRVVILGGGMIGSAMAMDLSREGTWDVTVADVQIGRAHV